MKISIRSSLIHAVSQSGMVALLMLAVLAIQIPRPAYGQVATIRQFKGFAIVQSPNTAEADAMPRSAIAAGADAIVDLDDIAPFINQLMSKKCEQA